jgi:putative colanic acid biosynthesis acetyltransferase WcaB
MVSYSSMLKEDWKRNKHNTKGLFLVLCFRFANFFATKERNALFCFMGFPIVICYKLFVEWVLSVELQAKTEVGPGLVIYHGQGLVVNEQTRIGKNVTLRHNTTIGNKLNASGRTTSSPVIGDNVDIGSNCVIIGNIYIGANALIGAGSVVTKDVPENAVVGGNPAKVIKIRV